MKIEGLVVPPLEPAPVTPEVTQQPVDEVVVSIGDTPEAETPAPAANQPAPDWVKQVRTRNRELERQLRDANKRLQELTQPKDTVISVKPTLQAFDYDTEKYEQALTKWYDSKKQADEVAARAKAEATKGEQEWAERLATYEKGKASFKAADFDEAEAVVIDLFSQSQQGVIVSGSVDPVLMVYALGKNENKAKELAAIKDPVKFAFAVAKLESQLKVTTRKPSTQPEGRVIGNSQPSGVIDQTLERLREDAARTGDYTKVSAYKRSKRS